MGLDSRTLWRMGGTSWAAAFKGAAEVYLALPWPPQWLPAPSAFSPVQWTRTSGTVPRPLPPQHEEWGKPILLTGDLLLACPVLSKDSRAVGRVFRFSEWMLRLPFVHASMFWAGNFCYCCRFIFLGAGGGEEGGGGWERGFLWLMRRKRKGKKYSLTYLHCLAGFDPWYAITLAECGALHRMKVNTYNLYAFQTMQIEDDHAQEKFKLSGIGFGPQIHTLKFERGGKKGHHLSSSCSGM